MPMSERDAAAADIGCDLDGYPVSRVANGSDMSMMTPTGMVRAPWMDRIDHSALIQFYQDALRPAPHDCLVCAASNGGARYDAVANRVLAASEDGRNADYHGPNDPAHKAVHEATEHLFAGRVSDAKARRGLRDALDHADKPLTGRPASDQSIGRAIRFGGGTGFPR